MAVELSYAAHSGTASTRGATWTAGYRQGVADVDARLALLSGPYAPRGRWSVGDIGPPVERIPGLGPTTIAWVLGATMNIAVCATPHAAAAYAGVALHWLTNREPVCEDGRA